MLSRFGIRASQVARRGFSTSTMLKNDTVKSSCKAGTVLNLKIRKNGDEPVALEDSEYPEWLWDMLDKKKIDDQMKKSDFMRWRRKQLGNENTKKINGNNFFANMK
ncbi:mitochondrial 54S ribosomal protein YmL37 [Scheffersomyces xylosifermentans]|uniref:mitochondrial 54S ribosomal protein YmL37 n=1 Tax=Scheffersomyces xylosifermentans TaxID=1304137 RepID=UPI00315C67E6